MSHDTPAAPDDQPPVRLLGYADLEAAYDHPDRVAALADRIAERRDDRTLVLGAGDDTALGQLALLTDEGRAQARPFFEAVEPDADTFGNHDFDFGREWAYEWAADVPATYVCANLDGPGADRVPDATVVERDGVRVGLVGVSHPETADLCGTVEGVRFTDPVSAATATFERLGPVDYRVVLSHCGALDDDVAAGVDADVVLGGHLHDRHVERVDGTLVVRTAGGGIELSEVTLRGDGDPDVRFHEIDGDGAAGDAVDPATRADSLAGTYRERRAALGLDEVVARVDGTLTRTREERFGGESRLGNFAADAFRAAADADVALFPAGSLRTGPPLSGAVTRGEVVSLCPFGGSVVEMELDGAALLEVLEAAASPHPGDRGWVRFHVSGLRVVWTDADEVRSVSVDGKPLDPDRTYRVAAAQYTVDVDGYDAIDWDVAVAEHVPQWQALVAHARDGGLDVALEERIRRVPARSDVDRPRAGADGDR